MTSLKKKTTMWITDHRFILFMIIGQALVLIATWAYGEWGAEIGRIPLFFFVIGSLIGILAESSTRNLTKGANIRATLKMTLHDTFKDENGAELLIITVKWIAFSVAGIALATMVANLA